MVSVKFFSVGFSFLILLCLPAFSAAGNIYRVVDADGRVSFSDKPSGATNEKQLQNKASRPFSRLPESVFEPVFQTSAGSIAAGKIFVVSLPGCDSALLVSALHLFGPAGGLPTQIKAQDLGRYVKQVALHSLKSGSLVAEGELSNMTPVSATPFGSQPMWTGDIAVFLAPAKVSDLALTVAEATPAKGEKVFVLTSVSGNRKSFTYEAVVFGDENGYLRYDFTGSDFSLRATSGAPVVNERGQVVAINVAGGQSGGSLQGLGTPVGKWRDAVIKRCSR